MEYILIYGQRRLEACKRLGWKTITAFIDKKESKDVPIGKIKVLDNTRIRIERGSLGELMQDIKGRGLLEPIGVTTKENLTIEEFVSDNLAENIHRKNLDPIEEAIGYRRLLEQGYNISEIVALVNKPKSRVETCLRITARIPEKFREKLQFRKIGELKPTGLSAAIANKILGLRIAQKGIERLLEEAIEHELTLSEVKTIIGLIRGGLSVEEAIEKRRDYRTMNAHIRVKKAEWDKMKARHPDLKFERYIQDICLGKVESNKELFK